MNVDVAIITVREDEERAILKRMRDRSPNHRRNRIYALSSINVDNGARRTIAAVRCPADGQSAAQEVARDVIEDLNPGALMVVGIGGGFPSKEFCLGDVAVVTRVQDLRVMALVEGNESEVDVRGWPVAREVETVVSALQRINLDGWNSLSEIGQLQPSVDLSDEKFYGPDDWVVKVREVMVSRFGESGQGSRPPIFITGAIVSTDFLVKSVVVVKRWKKFVRKSIGCEMEMAGVFHASRRPDRTYPVYGIRGISDIIGYKRTDEWTGYACETAAAFAFRLLRTGLIPLKQDYEAERVKPFNDVRLKSNVRQPYTHPIKRPHKSSSISLRPGIFEPGLGFIDRGEVEFAVATILGEARYERSDTTIQLGIASAWQKFGFVDEARRCINIIMAPLNFGRLTALEKAQCKLIELKLNSQIGNFKAVQSSYESVIDAFVDESHFEHRAAVYRRAGVAYAALGDQVNAEKCVAEAISLGTKLRGEHSRVTGNVFSAITLLLGPSGGDLDWAIKTLIDAPAIYLKSALDRGIFQAHPMKSAVMSLFSEAAIRLTVIGENPVSWICLTAAHVLSPLGSAHPKAEGYAELLGLLGFRKEYQETFWMAMQPDPDRGIRQKFLKKHPNVRKYLTRCQSLPELLHDRSPEAWLVMRQYLDEVIACEHAG